MVIEVPRAFLEDSLKIQVMVELKDIQTWLNFLDFDQF